MDSRGPHEPLKLSSTLRDAMTAKAGYSTPMLHVAEIEKSIRFYELLGFTTIDTEGCAPLAWARLHCEDGSAVMLLRAEHPVDASAQALILYMYTPDLGGLRDRVPTYASGALMRPHPVDYLGKAGTRLRDMGFRQMKMQCGSEPTVAASLERVLVVREAVGPDVDLMCDINQLWSVNHAIEVGRRLEPYHLYWLEDPVAHDDYAGLARVADALTTPIAAGEYHYGIVPFRHLLEARSIDVVMIDLVRVGGITQWMKVAAMAEAFNLPVVSHLVPEIHVQLVAAIPNGLTVEYMPWTLRLFEETPALEGGRLTVPTKPGLGLAFDQAAIKRYELA